MYKIEKKGFGFKLTFGDTISADEMQKWVNESEAALKTAASSFGVFVDMRTLNPLAPDVQAIMQKGQGMYKGKGMTRSVVILNNTMVTLQFLRIAKGSGIYQWERYLDASKNPNWEKVGVDWIVSGIDPDKK